MDDHYSHQLKGNIIDYKTPYTFHLEAKEHTTDETIVKLVACEKCDSQKPLSWRLQPKPRIDILKRIITFVFRATCEQCNTVHEMTIEENIHEPSP